jgi:hypothetical protein
MDLLNRIILYNEDLYKFISNKNEGYLHYVLASNNYLLYTSKFNFPVLGPNTSLYGDLHTYLLIAPSGMRKLDIRFLYPSSIDNNELYVSAGAIFIKHDRMNPLLLKWPITTKEGEYTLDKTKHFILVNYNI